MNRQSIGEKIRHLRRKKDLTQSELASKLMVSNSAISNWETGRRLPSLEELKAMAVLFETSLSYFDIDGLKENPSETKVYGIPREQSVECRELETAISPPLTFLYISASTSILIAYLFPSIFDLMFLLMGITGHIWAFAYFLIESKKHKSVNHKTVMVPVDDKLYYEHPAPTKTIRNTQTLMLVSLGLMVGCSVVLTYTLAVAFRQLDLVLIDLLVLAFALILVMANFYSFASLRKSPSLHQQVNFFNVKAGLKHESLVVSIILNTNAFIIIAAILIIEKANIERNIFVHMTLGILFVQIMLSQTALTVYRLFKSRFVLYHVDRLGKKNRLSP